MSVRTTWVLAQYRRALAASFSSQYGIRELVHWFRRARAPDLPELALAQEFFKLLHLLMRNIEANNIWFDHPSILHVTERN